MFSLRFTLCTYHNFYADIFSSGINGIKALRADPISDNKEENKEGNVLYSMHHPLVKYPCP
jgi:hypothetical protein